MKKLNIIKQHYKYLIDNLNFNKKLKLPFYTDLRLSGRLKNLIKSLTK